jgi:hypothetical protein
MTIEPSGPVDDDIILRCAKCGLKHIVNEGMDLRGNRWFCFSCIWDLFTEMEDKLDAVRTLLNTGRTIGVTQILAILDEGSKI